ncbi:MAG: 2-phospho-L-lactate transferase [Xanthomonadales bacterium]|nr:2-phospho-L-lactate transferase [Xanthomonadales bacterium]
MSTGRYLAITGGVGGAKLALGLSKILPPEQLAFAVNTGDDFRHLGLLISPDIDTLMYTLSGDNNTETGWGRKGESWQFMDALAQLGGETWFQLGDKDLALHVERTRRLAAGESLTRCTSALAASLGIAHPIWPMSDDSVSTQVLTAGGPLAFQHYFVRDKCVPVVTGFAFQGSGNARINLEILHWLDQPDLAGVILCPSNPFVSIDPLLSLPGMRERLARCEAPVIAVSPIVAGAAIKGPAAKMMHELSLPVSATAVLRHYADFLDGFIVDERDSELQAELDSSGVAIKNAQTVMDSLEDRVALARVCVEFCASLPF